MTPDEVAAKYGGSAVDDTDAIAAKYGGSSAGPKEDPRAAMLRAMGGPLGRLDIPRKIGDFVENAPHRAGGAATDLAARMMPPEAAAGIGTAVNIGLPTAAGGIAGRLVGTPMMRGFSEFLMRQALKPSWKEMSPGGLGPQAIQTLLNRRLGGNILPGENVSAGGSYNLEHRLNDIREQATSVLRDSSKKVAEKIKEIAPLQKEWGELENAAEMVHRRISGTPSGFPYWWIHRPKIAAAYIAAHSPTTTSAAARLIGAGQNYVPTGLGATAGAAIGGIEPDYQSLEGRLP